LGLALVDRETLEALGGVVAVRLRHDREPAAARAAPGGPEVEQHDTALLLREPYGLGVGERLQREVAGRLALELLVLGRALEEAPHAAGLGIRAERERVCGERRIGLGHHHAREAHRRDLTQLRMLLI